MTSFSLWCYGQYFLSNIHLYEQTLYYMSRYTPTPPKITLWLILSINFGKKLWLISNLFSSVVIHIQTIVLGKFFFFFSFSDQTWPEICGDAFHFQIIFIDCIVNFSFVILAQQFWSNLDWSFSTFETSTTNLLLASWRFSKKKKKVQQEFSKKEKTNFIHSLYFSFSYHTIYYMCLETNQINPGPHQVANKLKRFLLMIMSEALCNYTYHFHSPFFFDPFLWVVKIHIYIS